MYVTCADGLHLHAVVVQVGAALLAGDARFLEAKEGKIHLASNSMQCGKRFLSGDRKSSAQRHLEMTISGEIADRSAIRYI